MRKIEASNQLVHGGDIYRNEVELDFSVNINPLGAPEGVKKALHAAVECCDRYPDITAQELTEAVCFAERAKKGTVLCGNGASELFMAIVHALKPKKILIPVPSFWGYEWVAQASGADVEYYEMKREKDYCLDEDICAYFTDDTDMVFLADPNNPVGNRIPDELLLKISRICRERKICVVLDECFLPFTGQAGFFQRKTEDFPNLITVGAFTKIYAIPGVRLGYLITENPVFYKEIKKQLPEWNLSVFAQMAGCAAPKEKGYLKKTIKLLRDERGYLTEELKKLGIKVYPGEADYLFLETQLPLYERLLEEKILIRDCSNYRGLDEGFYRIAVKSRNANLKLIESIQKIME